jgi:ubiquinone/menaquinone biosynthesis C-methylase UbiE
VSELQHPHARSFESVAPLYERTRPEYPPAAVAWLVERLGVDGTSTVLDLGAGTGKLTRALVRVGARVVAVEPGPAMLAELAGAVPQADAVLGAAEAIPLPDESVDAVVCGQSFHWFRREEALPEIRRVLRQGRGLGLIWNLRHPDDELQGAVTALLGPFVPPGRESVPTSVEDLVAETFADVARRTVCFEQELDADGLVARVSSISFVAAADAARQAELERRLRELVAARGGVVAFRYLTEAYVTFAV